MSSGRECGLFVVVVVLAPKDTGEAAGRGQLQQWPSAPMISSNELSEISNDDAELEP